MKKIIITILFIFYLLSFLFAQNSKIDILIKLVKTGNEDTSTVNNLNLLSLEFRNISEFDSAYHYASRALLLSKKIIFKQGEANAYTKIGAINHLQSNYPEALKNYFSALQIRNEINDQPGIAASYNNIGLTLRFQGNYPEALKYLLLALKMFEDLGDKNGISSCYGNIGLIYSGQANYSEALKNYFASLKIKEQIGDKKGIGNTYNNIGNDYENQGQYVEALNYYFISLKLREEIKDKRGIGTNSNNIGNIYEDLGNYKDALKYQLAALKIQEEIEDMDGMATSYINLGSINTRLKNYTDAKSQFSKALVISKEIGSIDAIKDSYRGLTILDSATKNWEDAYQHYKLFIIYRDSLVNEGNIKTIISLQMQYQFEKKETTTRLEQEKKDVVAREELQTQKITRNFIAIAACITVLLSLFIILFYKRRRDAELKKQQAEQNQKQALLSLQVSETEMKSLRSQMNPHFIFNALQSIQTFLLNHKSDEANEYLLKFSKLMRLVLENSQHSEVSLKDDMQALELYMQLESIRLQHPFTYSFHIDKSVDLENDNIPPLILQPFVENAIWHGLQYKNEPGHINIFIAKKDNALYATVEDNGVGRDTSKEGVRPMLLKKESLGMKLTEERLKILNELKNIKAQFEITDLFTNENKPAGTKVELSLPLAS